MTTGQSVTMWIGFVWGLFGVAGFVMLGIDFYRKYTLQSSLIAKWNWKAAIIMIGFLITLLATLISAAITG